MSIPFVDNLTSSSSDPSQSHTIKIPSNIKENLLSDTANAEACFVNQRFSNKLQAFLVGYNVTILSEYPIYNP